MAENNNPYSILGVTKGISDKDLKTAYVNLVKKYDPEKHTERFMVIQAAYDKLRNPAGRAKEDLLTFNAPKGEYIFNGDERCVDNQGPEAAVLAKARADYRGEPGNETHRATLLRLLAQHAHHHVIRKMFVEAIRDWDEMLEIDPSHIRARHNLQLACGSLAYSYAVHGLNEEAIELWERTLKINPDDTEVIHNLAVVAEKAAAHVKAGRYWGEVVNRWKKKLEKDRDNEYLRLCIVEALQHHGDYMDEHPEANPASPPPPPPPSQAPVSPSAPTAPLRSPAATGGTPMQSSANVRKPEIPRPQATPAPAPAAPAGSIDRYREIARLKPDDFDAQFQLCSKLVEGQLYEEALTELGKLAKAHPKNIEVLNMMGWAYLYVGKKDEGFNCWKRSMAIDPKNAETRDHLVRAHLSLGRSFRQKGMFTQALVHFKQLLTLMPRSVEVHMEIAATYDMKGDVRSAASEYARVLTIDPKHKDARKAMNDLRMKR